MSWDAPIVARVETVATARVCAGVWPPTHPRAVRKTAGNSERSFCRSAGLSRRKPRRGGNELSWFKFPRNALVAVASRGRRASPPAGYGAYGAVRFEGPGARTDGPLSRARARAGRPAGGGILPCARGENERMRARPFAPGSKVGGRRTGGGGARARAGRPAFRFGFGFGFRAFFSLQPTTPSSSINQRTTDRRQQSSSSNRRVRSDPRLGAGRGRAVARGRGAGRRVRGGRRARARAQNFARIRACIRARLGAPRAPPP